MKICSKCHKEKPLTDFSIRYDAKHRRQSWCKLCLSAHNRKTYQEKPDRRNQIKRNTAKYKKEIENFLFHYLSSNPCIKCGENNILTLQFDHIRDKSFNIAEAFYNGYSLKRIQSEVEKCQILCANCHSIKNAQTINNWKLKWLNK